MGTVIKINQKFLTRAVNQTLAGDVPDGLDVASSHSMRDFVLELAPKTTDLQHFQSLLLGLWPLCPRFEAYCHTNRAALDLLVWNLGTFRTQTHG